MSMGRRSRLEAARPGERAAAPTPAYESGWPAGRGPGRAAEGRLAPSGRKGIRFLFRNPAAEPV